MSDNTSEFKLKSIAGIPNLNQPLLHEPAQWPSNSLHLGPLQYLVGTWTNQNLPNSTQGDKKSPYSYCVMSLPQGDTYILKNFSYYEEVTFSAINGTAPNRGGLGTQVANTLFYEQRVFFAEGPTINELVHAENGSWLYLTGEKQKIGPYNDGGDVPGSEAPTSKYNIVKQVSVPHGNSILAPGHFSLKEGKPEIPALTPEEVYPKGVDTKPYETKSVGNPNVEFTANPNKPLIDALPSINPLYYLEFTVDSENGEHPVTNMGFEQQHARVTHYKATYWLEQHSPQHPLLLQYTQTIYMEIPITVNGEQKKIIFPHFTTNTLTKMV